MPKQKTDDLVQLISSLTRAEKRHFRLFVRRNQASENILFLQLFNLLEKYDVYDEKMILNKLEEVKKRQLSNLKAHLYKQLLISLRLLNIKYNEDVQIREMIDYARVLYNKGLYKQSLEMLRKGKKKALKKEMNTLAMEILEFERLIEGQYITRSIEGTAERLTDETLRLGKTVTWGNSFSNLSIQMYSLFLKAGYVRSEKEYFFVREFFHSKLPDIAFEQLDFLGRVYYCQSFVWYYLMIHDFPMCYRYAQKWVDLFRDNPSRVQFNAPLYLKGMHNLLNALYNTLQYNKFVEVLEELKAFPEQFSFEKNVNIEGLYCLYSNFHTIGKHFLDGSFSEGLGMVPGLVEIIDSEKYNWDDHRALVFYYRIACLYFGSGEVENAIHYLNLIINGKMTDYREDIQCFARILNLLSHYELGNEQLLEYQLKSVYRFLNKMEDLQAVQKAVVRFLRKIPSMRRNELRNRFISLRQELLEIEKQAFERRPFLYLDIISWLESKIENKPVQEIIREKFEANRQRKSKS